MRRFDGKVAAVTGAGSGIGEACLRRFADEGASVAALEIDEARGAAIVEELKSCGADALFVATDVTDASSVNSAFDTILSKFGKLDVAVNNAGMGGAMATITDIPEQQWRRTLDLNLTGVFHCLRAELRALADRGGAIVNMASIFGVVGGARIGAYTAAKHGVIGLTKSAALEFGPLGVRVNAVAPTFVHTPLTADIDQATWDALAGLHSLGRFPTVEEVAAVTAFLASDEARSVTGSVYLVDAGYTAV